jgi:predicted Zn-dependent peptidase
MMAFRIPPFGADGWYAASVCAAVLGLRRGSRLYRSLVREREVASETSAFTYDLCEGSDLLVVDVIARPGTDGAALEREIVREVDSLVNDGVRADEISRALALIETDLIGSMQTAQERADRLSLFATYFGDAARLNGEPDRYRAVTADAVSAFANRYLMQTNRATLQYEPRTPAT